MVFFVVRVSVSGCIWILLRRCGSFVSFCFLWWFMFIVLFLFILVVRLVLCCVVRIWVWIFRSWCSCWYSSRWCRCSWSIIILMCIVLFLCCLSLFVRFWMMWVEFRCYYWCYLGFWILEFVGCFGFFSFGLDFLLVFVY